MTSMIAYCGLDCSVCPAHLAWKNNDDELRDKTAQEWSQMYGAEFRASQINCTGCKVQEEPHIGHCAECGIRSCASQRGWDHCGQCPDYACATLEGFFAMAPELKTRLEGLRN